MGVWIAVVLAGVVGVGLVWRRASAPGKLDVGAVSESWLSEQRADKRGPYS